MSTGREMERRPYWVDKQHEREAQIVLEAGRSGMVTIATNMAGRGTDIVLGGGINKHVDEIRLNESLSDEEKAQKIETLKAQWQVEHDKVIAAGGLRIIGSERHESRRIDNQLRGRAGRQGDPGSSCFYLSMEDPLLRIFGGDRMRAIADKLKLEEGVAIESNMLTRMIESAQRKVEGRNYDIRKQLLEFDDVQNDQRREIYRLRNEILESTDLSEMITNLRHGLFTDLFRAHVPEDTVEEQWDLPAMTETLKSEWGIDIDFAGMLEKSNSVTDEDLLKALIDEADRIYAEKVELAGPQAMNDFSRQVTLQVLDHIWRAHITALDALRQGIYLRGYAQKQPKQEYKREAFAMFETLLDRVRENVMRVLMTVHIQTREEIEAQQQRAREEAEARAARAAALAQARAANANKVVHDDEGRELSFTGTSPYGVELDNIDWRGVSRNALCPCGSGKKFKNCHGHIGEC